jgi:Iap family predicted aminopeptidase
MRWIPTKIVCLSLVFLSGILLASSPCHAQQQVPLSTPEEIKAEFSEVPCKRKDRLPAARAMFERMGATQGDLVEQKIGGVTNLILKLAGQTDETIVIGAHYDFIDSGCGAIDNWSGIVAIAHAYRTIKTLERKKTVLFVAFDREEEGLVGSRAMVNAIPKADIPRYCAMINIDSFGLAVPFALKGSSSDSLTKLSTEVSEGMKMAFSSVTIPDADSDSTAFIGKKIPAVTLSGLTDLWQTILHTSRDQKTMVNGTSVYLGYRLATALWDRINEAPCDAFREQKGASK